MDEESRTHCMQEVADMLSKERKSDAQDSNDQQIESVDKGHLQKCICSLALKPNKPALKLRQHMLKPMSANVFQTDNSFCKVQVQFGSKLKTDLIEN